MVPTVLAGWRWVRNGLDLMLYARDGRDARIRIRTRVTPLAPAPQILNTILDDLQISGLAVAPYEAFATIEGEYCTLLGCGGLHDGRRVEVAVAILFGDDWYVTIEGVTVPDLIEALRADIRELARNYSLGLGELRRRRYRYASPKGWLSRSRGLIDEWHAPGGESSLLVFPARPLGETNAGAVDRALHELVVDGFVATADEQRPLNTSRIASGIARSVVGTRDGKPVHHDVAVLQDERFFYVARLESPPDALVANRQMFAKLLDSIEPLPRPQRDTNEVDPALSASWVD